MVGESPLNSTEYIQPSKLNLNVCNQSIVAHQNRNSRQALTCLILRVFLPSNGEIHPPPHFIYVNYQIINSITEL